MSKLFVPAAAVICLAGLAAPGEAQAQGTGQSIMEVIVYGSDPCPRSTESEIVVCVRRGEEERYRIPEAYRSAGPPQPGQAWATRARTLETVGDTGIQSCSAVGPAGYTGCLEQLIRQATNERRGIQGDVPPGP